MAEIAIRCALSSDFVPGETGTRQIHVYQVQQSHSVSVCLFLVRGGRCWSRTTEFRLGVRRP